MALKIIAHRGLWRTTNEQNTPAALIRAVEAGFGFETDVRDVAGELRISHDPPMRTKMTWGFTELLRRLPRPAEIAVNVKSTGLS